MARALLFIYIYNSQRLRARSARHRREARRFARIIIKHLGLELLALLRIQVLRKTQTQRAVLTSARSRACFATDGLFLHSHTIIKCRSRSQFRIPIKKRITVSRQNEAIMQMTNVFNSNIHINLSSLFRWTNWWFKMLSCV